MASVFLSYDRDDTGKARPIALALEKAGHSVWWDLHVRGGAQFSKVIEEALKASDVVVVLWSVNSIESAWVRDEAAAGRDSGRLVPATIDGTEPPLGFRQYQTINLSRRGGRKAPPKTEDLLRAIEAIAGGARDLAPMPSSAEPQSILRRISLRWATIALLLAVAVAALLASRPWTLGGPPAIAVSAADASPASRDLARDLLTTLGQLQGADSGGLELVAAAERKRASLAFEVAAVTDRQESRANLVLVDGRNGSLLWSKAFQRPAAKAGDLRQELSYTAAQVLRCALEAHPGGRLVLKRDTLKTYLNGCAGFSDEEGDTLPELLPVFRQVVTAAPRFDAGWSKLLMVEDQAYVNTSDPRVRRQLTRDVRSARTVNPRLAAAYAAEMGMLPFGAWAEKLAIADRGIAANPSDTWLLLLRGEALAFVGRTRDGVNDRRLAVRADPLSPRLRDSYIGSLADAGQFDAALSELQAAERLWPDSSSLAATKLAFHFDYGSPHIALQVIRSGNFVGDWGRGESFLQARIDPTRVKIERALEDARALYHDDPDWLPHYVRTLSAFHRDDDLLDLLMSAPLAQARFATIVMFRPATREFWRDPRALRYAKRIGLLQYWQSSGKWPDFCSDADLPYDCKKEAARLTA